MSLKEDNFLERIKQQKTAPDSSAGGRYKTFSERDPPTPDAAEKQTTRPTSEAHKRKSSSTIVELSEQPALSPDSSPKNPRPSSSGNHRRNSSSSRSRRSTESTQRSRSPGQPAKHAQQRRDYSDKWKSFNPAQPHSPRSPRPPHIRTNKTHTLFFGGGALSNWYMGVPFRGFDCFEVLLPLLRPLGVPIPPEKAFSTQLVLDHDFLCGEQFMMAIKAWLFETHLPTSRQQFSPDDFAKLRSAMMSHVQGDQLSKDEANYYSSTLCKILRARTPRDHKWLGKSTPIFDELVWYKASSPAVTACSVIRAEMDPQLGMIYEESEGLRFAEASPTDRIWGVGLAIDDPAIDDWKTWKGENRLGKCHDEARWIYLQRKTDGEKDMEPDEMTITFTGPLDGAKQKQEERKKKTSDELP